MHIVSAHTRGIVTPDGDQFVLKSILSNTIVRVFVVPESRVVRKYLVED